MGNGFLKKSLVCACCGVMALSGLMFAGCSKEEIKENTAVVTESAIETATNILPYEYSTNMAKAILANACATSLLETNLKSEWNLKGYSFGGMNVLVRNSSTNATSIYINNNGIVTEKGFSSDEDSIVAYTITTSNYSKYAVIGDKYQQILNNVNNVSNTSIPSYYGRFFLTGNIGKSSGDGCVETISMLSNVKGGRYYNGKTYINASIEYNALWGEITNSESAYEVVNCSIEYVIENDRITNVTLLKNIKVVEVGDNVTVDVDKETSDDILKIENNEIETINFTYGGQTINDAPTSLDGLTLDETPGVIYYFHYGFDN